MADSRERRSIDHRLFSSYGIALADLFYCTRPHDRMAVHTNHMLEKLGALELVPKQALQSLWQDVPDNSNERREPPQLESLRDKCCAPSDCWRNAMLRNQRQANLPWIFQWRPDQEAHHHWWLIALLVAAALLLIGVRATGGF